MNAMIKSFLFIFLFIPVFFSCEIGLDELPYSQECEISDFTLERRYVGKEERITSDQDGNVIKYWVDKVMFEAVANKDFNLEGTTIFLAVPDSIDLTNVVGLATISVGARIEPIDGSPSLGERGDFCQPHKYRVTASDGSTYKDWVITVQKAGE